MFAANFVEIDRLFLYSVAYSHTHTHVVKTRFEIRGPKTDITTKNPILTFYDHKFLYTVVYVRN